MQCIDYSTNYSESRCLMQQVIIICAVAFWSRFSSCWSRFSKTHNRTPLHYAASCGAKEAVKAFLENPNATVNLRNTKG
jgi:hypothetical protein